MKHYATLFCLLALATASCCKTTDEVSVNVNIKNSPVLCLKESNDIATIVLKSEKDFTIKQVSIALESDADLSDFESISIADSTGAVLGTSEALKGLKATVKIDATANCIKGNKLVILAKTKDQIELDSKTWLKKVTVCTDLGKCKTCVEGPVLRKAVALRQDDQDGCDNCRIPGLAVTKEGTIIAVYDARYEYDRDLQGDIDINYNRSTDGGYTWSEMMTAMDMGEWGGLPEKFNGCSDPSITVDTNSGDIYVAATWMYGVLDDNGKWIEGLTKESDAWNHQWRLKGSQPGYDPKQSSQYMVVKSTDDGLTWSEPMNITRQVKPENWWLMTTAPGAGITLEDGTIVIPSQGRENQTGRAISTLVSTKDGGQTWTAGTPISDSIPCNECMCVQLSDGSIMLNCRSTTNRGKIEGNGRIIGTTTDLGQTWTIHPTSQNALIEPTCQGSILKHHYTDKSGQEHTLILFFNPNDQFKRIKHTIKCSDDEGNTWPQEWWLEVDEGKGAGYSCMVSIDNDTIGVLYEGSGANLIFQRIKVADFYKK